MRHTAKHTCAALGLAALLALPAAPARADIDLGTIVGAGLGGVIGNQIGKGTGNTVATVAGVIIGGVAGHTVNNNWNRGAHYRHGTMAYYAPQPVTYYRQNYVAPPAPPPTVVYSQTYYQETYPHHRRHARWRQPVVQQVYTQPVVYAQPPAYVTSGYGGGASSSNSYCREYTNRVVIGNRVQESYGTACLQPDGSWQTR